jgi:hypothetical protein
VTEPDDKRAAATPHRFLRRLHRVVVDHIAQLSPEEALHFAVTHQLFSLADRAELSEALRGPLEAHRQGVLAQSLLRIWQFQDAVDALEPAEIPVCALKGIALLDSLYRHHPGQRAMTDIDLLVPSRRVDEAARRLCRRLQLRETSMSRRLRHHSHHRLLVGPRLKLELHTRLWLQYGRGADWGTLRPRPATIHDRQAFCLDEPTLFCHLITHLVSHGPLVSLKWVEDLARLGDRYQGTGALERARELGAMEPVVAGVRLLRGVLGPDYAPAFDARLGGLPGLRVWLNERLVWSYLAGGTALAAGPGTSKLRRNLTALLLAPGCAEAARLAGSKAVELLARARDASYWREAGRPVAPADVESRGDDDTDGDGGR